MKRKTFIIVLTSADIIDEMIEIDKKEIIRFVLNYRACIEKKWEQIYRVDNFHGFLHEHKFWRSPEPIPINVEEKSPLVYIVEKYKDQIVKNFRKYKFYFEQSKKE